MTSRLLRPLLFIALAPAAIVLSEPAAPQLPTAVAKSPLHRACPAEMAQLNGYCIDRFEISLVDKTSGAPLSPYYPASPKLLRFVHNYWSHEARRLGPEWTRGITLPPVPDVQQKSFSPLAQSRAGVVPQGYLTYHTAKLACENAGKRLCSEDEWVGACKGTKKQRHPYGPNFTFGRCNIFRGTHPAFVLHENTSLGHLDPRLNLVFEDKGSALLKLTGEQEGCVSTTKQEAVFDMVGNLDEWIDDPKGTFVGGFYARATREGCEAKIEVHGAAYTDYSLGTRCCLSAKN